MATGQVYPAYFSPCPHRHILNTTTHPLHCNINHLHLTRKWKAPTRGPLDTPAQVIQLERIPYVPTNGSTLKPWFRRQELTPRGKNEAKHHPPMATHPSHLAFYYLEPQVTTMSETFHQHHNYGNKSPDNLAFN